MKNTIYQIVNTVTGIRYIGSAKSFKRRKQSHLRGLRRQKHNNSHLQNSFNKHGEEAFIFEVIDTVPYAIELEDRENYWMDKYDFDEELYNQCPVAGSRLGAKLSEEQKKVISLRFSGKNHPNYGKSPSEETREKIARSQPTSKRVVQIDKKTGKIIVVFESIREAARQTAIPRQNISAICLNKTCIRCGKEYKHKTAGGYAWKFVDELEKTNLS